MSFCNNNIIDVASDRGSIYLGVWDTLNVRQQQFDVSAWLDAYGDDGVLTVLNQRRTDELPYEVADVTLEGGVATWTFDETDTAVVGEGKAALVYIRAGETIARTVPFPTYTAPTIGMTGVTPPDPWESWYTRVLEASAAAQQSATSAAGSADAAIRDARRAEEAANDAAGSALDAARYAGAAADSARDAARDAGAAAGSAEAASGSAISASGYADDASGYATNAYDDADRADRAAEAAAADAASIADSASILADWAQHKYDAFATESAQGEAIKTDLGAALPMAKLNLLATAGSGTVTVRQMGANLLDARSLSYSALGLTFAWSGDGFRVSGTTTSGAGSRSSLIGQPANIINYPLCVGVQYVFSCSVSGNTSGRTFTNFDLQVAYTDGRSPSTAAFTPEVPFVLDRPAVIRLVRVYNGWNTEITAGETYDFTVHAQLEVGSTPTNYEPPTNTDYAVTVSGAETYPVTPTPTTALGVNTLWIVPGSGVTATLDGTFRLDPTLVYNALRGA